MQQTETYKLNLIETSDTFSPAPLNENAQKLEAAITAEAAARQAADTALDQRVQVLELHKFVAGTYTGNSESGQFIPLPFTPAAVLLDNVNMFDPRPSLAVAEYPLTAIRIVSGGFMVYNTYTANDRTSANSKDWKYRYLAFA